MLLLFLWRLVTDEGIFRFMVVGMDEILQQLGCLLAYIAVWQDKGFYLGYIRD